MRIAANAPGLSRVTSKARTPPLTSAWATGMIELGSSRRRIPMTRVAAISCGIGGRRPGWSGKGVGKLLQEMVDHGALLAVEGPARRPALFAGDDPAADQDRLFRLDDQFHILHPVRDIWKHPSVDREGLLVLAEFPGAPDVKVNLGERTAGLHTQHPAAQRVGQLDTRVTDECRKRRVPRSEFGDQPAGRRRLDLHHAKVWMGGREPAQRLGVDVGSRQAWYDLNDDGHIDCLQDGREMVEDGAAGGAEKVWRQDVERVRTIPHGL